MRMHVEERRSGLIGLFLQLDKMLRGVNFSQASEADSGTAIRQRAEIERLARTSPHLLADIGFETKQPTGSPEAEVWEGSGLRVVRQSRGVDVLVAASEVRGR